MQFTSQLEQGDWFIVASWLCVVIALALCGIGIALAKFRQTLVHAGAKRKTARAIADPTQVPRLPPRPEPAARTATVHPKRPDALGHWCVVIAIVETGLRQVEAMSACHAAAARHIDAAEYALNRLMADYTKVMRRPHLAPLAPPRPLRSSLHPAVAEPLAA